MLSSRVRRHSHVKYRLVLMLALINEGYQSLSFDLNEEAKQAVTRFHRVVASIPAINERISMLQVRLA